MKKILPLPIGGVMYQYFVKIVPTVYKDTLGSVSLPLNQVVM